MKIEKISDSQIRCTLNRADLQSRELKISELAYGSEKAKDLFHDMIEQASHQFGFEADDLPLMIEAIPISADCIVLIITKVEDPEELDTRFSKFAPSDEDLADANLDDESGFDMEDIFPTPKEDKTEPDELLSNIIKPEKDSFIPIRETLNVPVKASEEKKDVPTEEPDNAPVSRLFSFKNWNEASKAALGILGDFKGDSMLYKNPTDGLYFLLLSGETNDSNAFFRVCNEITEYGKKEPMTYTTIAFLKERCDIVIKSNALEILKKY